MKKIVGVLIIGILVFVSWWTLERYVFHLSPSAELNRMVSAARLGDEEGFLEGFTEESRKMIRAMLSISHNYSHVRTSPISRIADTDIVDERIENERAIVLVQSRSKVREIPMVWTDSGWKIDAFEMEEAWNKR